MGEVNPDPSVRYSCLVVVPETDSESVVGSSDKWHSYRLPEFPATRDSDTGSEVINLHELTETLNEKLRGLGKPELVDNFMLFDEATGKEVVTDLDVVNFVLNVQNKDDKEPVVKLRLEPVPKSSEWELVDQQSELSSSISVNVIKEEENPANAQQQPAPEQQQQQLLVELQGDFTDVDLASKVPTEQPQLVSDKENGQSEDSDESRVIVEEQQQVVEEQEDERKQMPCFTELFNVNDAHSEQSASHISFTSSLDNHNNNSVSVVDILKQLESLLINHHNDKNNKVRGVDVDGDLLASNENEAPSISEVLCDEGVVRSLQKVLSSEAVTQLVVDLSRNDINIFSAEAGALKGFVLNHLAELLIEVGAVLKETPESLSLLPFAVKALLKLLDGNEKNQEEVEQPTEMLLKVHEDILCDECCDDETRRNVSEKAGHRVDKQICGVRYKSATRSDYDLCASCEASGLFDSNGPFLKLKDPNTKIKEIFCLLKDNIEAVAEIKKEEVGEDTVLRCPRKGHELKAFSVPNRLFACDVCDKRPKRLSVMYGCRSCDWDMCLDCAKHNNKHLDFTEQQEHLPTPRGTPVYARPNVTVSPAKLCMKFVGDETAFDGVVLSPGESFRKGWRVRNSGTRPWPVMTRVVCVSKDMLGASNEGSVVIALPPGEIGTIWVDMVAPRNPGRYTSFWRLVAPREFDEKKGCVGAKRFGDRLWVDIVVKGERKKENKWGKELEKLAEMDFTDMGKNIKLLERFGGELERVVNGLLKKHTQGN